VLPQGEPLDTDLVIAARDGDVWAYEFLCRRHLRMVYGLASRFAGAADLDDLVQDAFVAVLCSLRRLKTPASFTSWLATVVVRTAYRRFRRRRQLEVLNPSHDPQVPVESLTSKLPPPDVLADLQVIDRFLQLLPVETRMAFVLQRVEEMSIGEIADAMGRSTSTVKRRLTHAERRLDARILRTSPREPPTSRA
jgi:RNA polymerase sigma-70 factor (ECF subfamily)